MEEIWNHSPEIFRDFGITVFDVEPFGHELASGLSLRVEDKAEWLRRNEKFSVVSML